MRSALLLGLLAGFGLPLRAQCPDGSPPPCASARAPARAAPRAVDPNRIAILPFRVATADTLLGEGVAELLSQEFAGGSGPQAVHMGTVIRAWRQAGGGPRAPLPPDGAIRAARAMGAGLVVDGSIVGLGSRLTVNAAVITVPDGRTRRASPVSGSADSLDVLLRRLTTSLIAVAGGEPRAIERGALTESPAAMRAYIEGLAAWRRYNVGAGSRAFERAWTEDSTFARAAFMRMVLSSWGAGNRPTWERRAWALRARLSPQDRLLLVAYLGEQYPEPRSPARILADRQRAAQQLPESPEAQYVLADWLFHYGAAADVPDRLDQAQTLFSRSLALDTQETVLAHLVEAAALRLDTSALRELRPAIEAGGPAMWGPGWLAASLLDDDAWLERLRRRRAAVQSFAFAQMPLVGIDGARIEEAFGLVLRTDSGALTGVTQLRYYNAIVQGRPAAASRLALGFAGQDLTADVIVALSGLFADGDSVVARAAADRLLASSSNRFDVICATALLRMERGVPATWNDSLLRAGGAVICASLLDIERARRAGAGDLAQRVAAADSVMRFGLAGSFGGGGFENLILSRAWEAAGNPRRALAAARLRSSAIAIAWSEVPSLRVEGRLAALLGDTTGAIRAYRRYLLIRRDPEPALIPQRDSVRAELARLESRR